MNGAIAFALNDSIKKNDSVIKNDSSHIDIKVPPSAELQKMLSDEDYIYDRVGPAPKTPWERFKEWFWRMVDDLFDSNGGKIGLGILKYLLIVAAIVLIIFLLIKNDIRALFYGKSASIAIDFKEFEEDIHSINFQELNYASRITYLSLPSSTISLSSLPTLKKGTFFGGTFTIFPVLGLRPSYAL